MYTDNKLFAMIRWVINSTSKNANNEKNNYYDDKKQRIDKIAQQQLSAPSSLSFLSDASKTD